MRTIKRCIRVQNIFEALEKTRRKLRTRLRPSECFLLINKTRVTIVNQSNHGFQRVQFENECLKNSYVRERTSLPVRVGYALARTQTIHFRISGSKLGWLLSVKIEKRKFIFGRTDIGRKCKRQL